MKTCILLAIGVLLYLVLTCNIENLNPFVDENKYLTNLTTIKNRVANRASVSRLQFENLKRKKKYI